MKIFKVFVDMEAEETYLNQMAQKGYLLQKYSNLGFYHFSRTAPQSLNYRVDYRFFSTQEQHKAYEAFFLDAGWRLVYGTSSSGSQYFLPVCENASAELFSDSASSLGRYKRYLCVSALSCIVYLAYILIALVFFQESSFQNPARYILVKYVVSFFCFLLAIIQGSWIIRTLLLMRQRTHKAY